MSRLFFERTRFKLTCNAKMSKKLSLTLFQILTCIYSLRKVQEVELLMFVTDTAKAAINI